MRRRLTAIAAIMGFVFTGYLWIQSLVSVPPLAASGGTITGRVVFTGDAPPAKKIKVTKDNAKCGQEIVMEDLAVSSERGVKNAVVNVMGVKGAVARSGGNPILDQKGCVFNPHVLIVQAGKPFDILNNDGVLHNFHSYSQKNSPVNKAQPGFKKKMMETFAQPEIMKVTCDAHPWMTAWIVVTDRPYVTTTDGDGAFKLTDVPPGNHTVEIWHETLGKTTKTVTVKAGEDTKVNFELSPK